MDNLEVANGDKLKAMDDLAVELVRTKQTNAGLRFHLSVLLEKNSETRRGIVETES